MNGTQEMNKTQQKIQELFNNGKLVATFIRLDSGRDNQKNNIDNKRFFIGYNAGNDEILKLLNTPKDEKLDGLSFRDEINRVHKNLNERSRLAAGALLKVYQDCGDTLWFTIVDGILHYGFTDGDKKTLYEKYINVASGVSRDCVVKKMLDGWCKTNIKGEELYEREISGKITKLGMIRATVSDLDKNDLEYLIKSILCEKSKEKLAAITALKALKEPIPKLLQQLNDYDLETLVEMLFLSQGYTKIAKTSGNEKVFDLALNRPFDRQCSKPTFVQIKCAISKEDVEKVFEDFCDDKSFGGYSDIGFLVCHSKDKKIEGNVMKNGLKSLRIVDSEEIALQCIEFGKIEWLLKKVV